MKIIDAVWEKRNLGVTCVEIEIEKSDGISQVIDVLRARNEQYQVVKMATGRPDMAFALQDEGFRYIETLIETGRRFRGRPETPELCRRFEKDISYHYANDAEMARVIAEIRKGDIFATDRISLDPAFSKALAGRRYALWMQDLLAGGKASMVISCYRNEAIGFSIHHNRGSYYDMVLGGLLPEYLDSGYGFVNSYCGINAVYEEGAKVIRSHVSSNNVTILKLHLMFGMQVKSLSDVFIRHRES